MLKIGFLAKETTALRANKRNIYASFAHRGTIYRFRCMWDVVGENFYSLWVECGEVEQKASSSSLHLGARVSVDIFLFDMRAIYMRINLRG